MHTSWPAPLDWGLLFGQTVTLVTVFSPNNAQAAMCIVNVVAYVPLKGGWYAFKMFFCGFALNNECRLCAHVPCLRAWLLLHLDDVRHIS